MRKSDKKIDNQIRLVLTHLCESKLESIPGFLWLTHTVDYQQFPQTLNVICVFDNNQQLDDIKANQLDKNIVKEIQKSLNSINVKVPKPDKQIKFDSEQNCQQNHSGNWNKRLR